jgi:hypothetical protein
MPDRYMPDLADSLNKLSDVLIALDRSDEAAVAHNAAEEIRMTLRYRPLTTNSALTGSGDTACRPPHMNTCCLTALQS